MREIVGSRGLVGYALDCGEGGPRFESRTRHFFFFRSEFNGNSRILPVRPSYRDRKIGPARGE